MAALSLHNDVTSRHLLNHKHDNDVCVSSLVSDTDMMLLIPEMLRLSSMGHDDGHVCYCWSHSIKIGLHTERCAETEYCRLVSCVPTGAAQPGCD